ncbi:MAG: AAA family ATPase [Marinobacter sp.]
MSQHFDSFKFEKQLYASSRTLVVAAHRLDNGAAVVLKVPQPWQRGDQLKENYAKEAYYRRTLGQGEVELSRHFGLPMLVIPDPDGRALRDLSHASEAPSLSVWLKIARTATQQLKELHSLGVVHRDVHPGNLLWNATTERVALVDFELAVPVIHAEANPIARQQLEGALPYMAPEATGRMNIGVDERSDLYALGATLYELLVDQRPFTAADPLELVHQHMTQVPIPPHECRADIPHKISSIILKLLNKSPDQRYQSARGLAFDLALAQEQFEHSGRVADFELGCHDIAERYRPDTSLYGRDADRADLLQAMEDVRSGARRLYVVGGYSGIGKTALLRQVREPVLLAGGIYAEGKCDQYQRLQPYSAWGRALDSVVSQILGRPQSQRDAVKEKVLAALGGNGRLLTDIVPFLEELIGPQPAVGELGVIEARNRLSYVFVAFLASIADELPPLVIFLDDLQWIDNASLDLLQAIAQSNDIQQLLVVGAYRDNEVDAAHPLQQALNDMRKSVPEALQTTTLGNLSVADITAMCATNLNMAHEAAEALASAVHTKTAGNPFFSHQLLKRMADLRLLRFDDATPGWVWDSEQLNAMPPADNVIDLLLERLRELPEQTHELLQLGAGIGDRFEPATLATVADCAPQEAEQALELALKEGLLYREAYSFKFTHDRVQQAAYNLIAPDERAALHLRIGRQLLAAQTKAAPGRALFDIIEHFDRSQELLIDPAERGQIAELAEKAAYRAQAASAHDIALRYYRLALTLAGEAAWQNNPQQHWRLYLDAIQSEFNNAHHENVAAMIAVAAAHARTRLDRVALFELECQFAIARNDQNAAIDLALEALALLDLYFTADAPALAEQAPDLRAAIQLPAGGIEALADLPEMTDPEQLAAIRIMVSTAGAAYVMRPELWEVLTLQMVLTTLKHGSSPLAAFAYGFYGVLLASVYQDIDKGYAFGRLSTQLLEHYGAEPLRAKIVNLFDVFVRHWKEHLRNSLETLPRGLQSGIDHGDFEYGSYNAIQHGKHQVICGCPLEEVLEQQNAYFRVIDRLKMGYHLDFARIWRQLAINLSGQARDPLVLAGDDYNAEALIPRLMEQSSNFLVFNIQCTQTMLAYLLGHNEEALAAADAAVQHAHCVSGMAEIAQHNFFHSLCLLAALEPEAAQQNRRLLRQVVHNQRQLEVWSQHAPMNFRHKWNLVEAERLRRSSRPQRATHYYEQAIQGAQETYYLNDQALATELYGEFMLEQGQVFVATTLIREALRLYDRWQAHEKVRQLRRRYVDQLQNVEDSDTQLTSGSSTSVTNFDSESALRASLAIGNETDIDALKCRLMRILAENAGAQRGLMVLKDEGVWMLAAEVDEDGPRALESALEEAADVPQLVFARVIRSQRSLVLDDPFELRDQGQDPYLGAHDVRSVLCVPLVHGDQMSGLLYLENRHTPRAFSASSAKVVEILAAQAFVAIEKARLLATLEQRVEARTKEARLASERFSEAFNSAALGMALVSLEGRWLDVNEAIPSLFGYSREELLATDFQSLTHPDDLGSELAQLNDLLAGRINQYQMKKRYYRQDGSIMHALLSVGLVTDDNYEPLHFVSQIQDVSGEHHAIQELEANRHFLQQLFDSLDDAIVVLDAATTIISHNRAASELLELPADAIGSSLGARLPGLTERLATEETQQRTHESLLARWNTPLEIAGKAPIPLELSLSRTRGQYDPLQGWILVARDLTENYRHEQLKNEFVSAVTHELRTPLTSISGSLRLISGGAMGEVPERMNKMLRIAEQNADKLIQLVNDLLDLNKLVAGKMDLSFEQVDLIALIDGTVNRMKSYAEPFKVTLRRTGSSKAWVHGDPYRLEQVLANLMSNACKHSESGSEVTINCECSEEGEALVSVIDQGSGIPESFRDRIFERFAQAEGSDSRTKGGTGLGLVVTRELIERMGGVIGFHSSLGEGARFWFRIPRAEPTPTRSVHNAQVLLVEDNSDLAMAVVDQLAQWVRVDHADSLQQAHDCLKNVPYDLVLLDMKLDNSSAVEIWESLFRDPSDVPVVILSGYEIPEKFASRIAAVMNKASLTPEEIVEKVVELFKRERSTN